MYLKRCKKEHLKCLEERKGKEREKMKKIKLTHIKLDFRTPSNHNSVIVGNFNTPYVLKIIS